MNQLYLDYQRNYKPIPWAGIVLVLLASTGLTIAEIHYQGLAKNIDYWEIKTGELNRASERKLTGSKREINDIALEVKHANEVLNQITLPWEKLFQAVEWSSGKDVALLTIEPDAEKHVVKISGEAKNITAVLGYISHLSGQEMLSGVYLQSHEVQLQNPEKPVRFSLVAAWKDTP